MLMSIRMPATFLPSIMISFGHLSLGLRRVAFLIESQIARAAANGSKVILEAETIGLKITDNHIPPLGDSQFLFTLPRPLVCCSAIITAPSELGSFSASEIARF